MTNTCINYTSLPSLPLHPMHSPMATLPFFPFLLLLLFFLSLLGAALSQLFPNRCGERCGALGLPFPFHLNASCGPPIAPFRLSCRNNGTHLYLSLGPTDLRVISFLSSGSLLLDYSPNSSLSASSNSCDPHRWYSSVASRVFDRSEFFAVTARNVLRLYDCEDSSVCSAEGCGSRRCEGDRGGCCYALADGSVWKSGDGFEVFGEFGCRGFSSWAVPRSGGEGERGIEMEWAVPKGHANGTECADGAAEVNATAVRDGVRCACGAGFLGDGFAAGAGCFKSCEGGRSKVYSRDCCKGRFRKKKAVIFTGVLVCLFLFVVVLSCYFLLRNPSRTIKWDPDSACLPKIFARACRTRVFTYQELNKATKGFVQDQTLIDENDNCTIHSGVLNDGSLVAVQRVRCETQQNLGRILKITEILSESSHNNIARVIGWCRSSGYTLLVVHELFPADGTLEELLQPCRGNESLNWYRRINIATEVASAFAHLQLELSPTIDQHYGIKSNDIYILADYSIKIVTFKIISSGYALESRDSNMVYNFSIILLKLIVGSELALAHEMVREKIEDKRFHEIVDPCLKFGEEFLIHCEKMETLAIFALHCVSQKGLCMVEVAKEFIRIVNDNSKSISSTEPTLEVTFSSSSLLQMVSVSPDSLHVP